MNLNLKWGHGMKNTKQGKWFKGLLILLIIVLILLGFRNLKWYKNKYEIKKLVNSNLEFLNESIENKIYELEEVKDIRKWPLDDNGLYIDFYYKGYGIVSASIYFGFYYVSEDKPTGFQGYPHILTSKGKGWEWKESNGDNWYYTEKIADHWYYYEAGF